MRKRQKTDRSRPVDPVVLERLRWCAHPRLYLAQLTDPERAGLGDDPGVDAVVEHYLDRGAEAGPRICALFNPDWYAERLAELGLAVPEGEAPFLHWLTVGWERKVVPTPLFDPAWYLEHHPALRSHPRWVFHHYLTRGCYQPQWLPSPAGRHHGGAPDDDAARRQDPLFLPELLHRADEHDLRRTSWLEAGVLALLEKRSRIESDELREQIAKAAELEPRIHAAMRAELPTIAPPHAHPGSRMVDEVAAARASLGLGTGDTVDTIVLVPHCRMSGSARVAGLFTEAARAAGGADSVAVIATDLPAFERPELFPEDVRVLDLTRHIAGMAQPARRDLLHDLLRGLRPRQVVLINSLLGWQLVSELGDQLAEVMDVGAYLFTWELDENGHPYGYPVGPFQHSFEHLSWVLFDSERMRSELVDRYLMHEEASRRLIFLRNPLADWSVDVTGVFERRRAAGVPLRALWAGRFDRQKRFDLVVEIARMLPDLEICAWGKPVLRDLDLDPADLPPNIRLMGVYDGFDQLPLDDVDFLLYTSGWDGIPNVVLEGAQSGLPIVASAVGGVPEVVTPETGYPVADTDEPAAYVAAIERLLADPAAATRRSTLLREQVHELFDADAYRSTIAGLLEHGGA
ncbi:glycosyltransferase family 4 protein [Nocardioides sp. HM23]|uniref:glycosyltransferase family 4 protein n=1 Tax=Nocardioides bizhenqiangii TaxID=3095076 RepID=UPI002ACAD549|nr:glycosyltransferase family 4 protein [Nocardioides sp. HM23]MDZ5623115.1 glycosyltransferase family 4 protein [Nocardioides sp. HM23]